MPFNERTMETMREEFVKRALAKEKTKAELCREYGISRPTGDKWIARYVAGEEMTDRSRRAHSNPRKVGQEMEDKIVGMKKLYPCLGAKKIIRLLHRDKVENVPSLRTTNHILERNGLIVPRVPTEAKLWQRFVKDYPNEMWQADFKGHFMMGNGERCHPLNIEDDHSRFCICSKAQKTETAEETKPNIIEAFENHGLPYSFLCDNGNPWGAVQKGGFSALEVWMLELGILVLHGSPKHPQTQGKMERFNQSLKNEWLKYRSIANWEMAQQELSAYRDFYNNIRPHHAIALDTPAVHYGRSQQEYTDQISTWEYPENHTLCKVKSNGCFVYQGHSYFLSEGFRNKEIAIRPSKIEGKITLCFRQFRIARIVLESHTYDFKRAYLAVGDPRHK